MSDQDSSTKTITTESNQASNLAVSAVKAPMQEEMPFAVIQGKELTILPKDLYICLLYTSPSPRDGLLSRMPSSA